MKTINMDIYILNFMQSRVFESTKSLKCVINDISSPPQKKGI